MECSVHHIMIVGPGRCGSTLLIKLMHSFENLVVLDNSGDSEVAIVSRTLFGRREVHHDIDLMRNRTVLTVSKHPMGAFKLVRCKAALWPARLGVIFLVRDYRDVAVSFYHHYWDYKLYRKDFDHFFHKKFIKNSEYIHWFKHVHGWYTNPKKLDVLYIRYEDMKTDLPGVVRRVVDFCGFDVNEEQFQRVIQRSDFSFMKQHEEKFDLSTGMLMQMGINSGGFIRKGKVGGWEEYFKLSHLDVCSKLYRQWITGKVDLPYDL